MIRTRCSNPITYVLLKIPQFTSKKGCVSHSFCHCQKQIPGEFMNEKIHCSLGELYLLLGILNCS